MMSVYDCKYEEEEDLTKARTRHVGCLRTAGSAEQPQFYVTGQKTE
jgi:hypothetical protein